MAILGSLVLAALAASCDPNTAALASAEAQFKASDTAFVQKDTAAAQTAYESGMQQLMQTPWFIDDKACDPPGYTFQKYVVSLHSLVAGENIGKAEPVGAFQNEMEMWHGITQPDGAPPGSAPQAITFFMSHSTDLFTLMNHYDKTLRDRFNDAERARHSPAAGKCSNPDLPVEHLADSPIYYSGLIDHMRLVAAVPKGHYKASVYVKVADDGAVQDAYIAQSSGQRTLDDRALAEAKGLHYLPEIKDCRPVASGYIYVFKADTTKDIPLHP